MRSREEEKAGLCCDTSWISHRSNRAKLRQPDIAAANAGRHKNTRPAVDEAGTDGRHGELLGGYRCDCLILNRYVVVRPGGLSNAALAVVAVNDDVCAKSIGRG